VKRGVIPSGWDWAEFLSTAVRLLPIIFERKDCQKKWGHEFVMYSPLLGRSMRHPGTRLACVWHFDRGCTVAAAKWS